MQVSAVATEELLLRAGAPASGLAQGMQNEQDAIQSLWEHSACRLDMKQIKASGTLMMALKSESLAAAVARTNC